jgi:hypothetical protein
VFASLDVESDRRTEVFVEEQLPLRAWALLAACNRADNWQLRVIVHAGQLGVAHDAMRDTWCELQGWWHTPEGVAFGAVERA